MLDKILNKILNYLIPIRHVEDIPPGTIIEREVNLDHLHELANKNTQTLEEIKADLRCKQYQDHR